jgi:hypothetical protein
MPWLSELVAARNGGSNVNAMLKTDRRAGRSLRLAGTAVLYVLAIVVVAWTAGLGGPA